MAAILRPATWTGFDRRAMAECLSLAERGRGPNWPNPLVGCVISALDAEGQPVIVARGFHRAAGGPHAEREALARLPAGVSSPLTVYVNLEPCSHHGRTPPCADALIEAGIGRVVVAMADPDPRVSGRGLARLAQAGVRVELGLMAAAAGALNHAFSIHAALGRPAISLKVAMSLDGRTTTHSGASQWITGPGSRAEVHRRRAGLQAIGFGVGTVLADDPQGTARPAGTDGHQPIRLVFDTRLRTPQSARILDTEAAPTWMVCGESEGCSARAAALRGRGVRVLGVPRGPDGSLDLSAALERLAALGICQLQVEGGARLHGALLDAGLVDGVEAYLAPLLIGGAGARFGAGSGVAELGAALRLGPIRTTRHGPDVLLCSQRPTPAAQLVEEARCLLA